MTTLALTALIDFAQPQGGAGQRLRHAFGAPLRLLQADTAAQVKPLLEQVQAEAQAGRWCLGYVAYEAAPAFDAALRAPSVSPKAVGHQYRTFLSPSILRSLTGLGG